MTRTVAALAVLTAVGFALPQTASAQAPANDRQYCAALTDKYRAFVSDPDFGRNNRPNAEYEIAISKCKAGDTAGSIPLLEKALRDARISLPPHG